VGLGVLPMGLSRICEIATTAMAHATRGVS
jgi:hypothetical protein